MLIALIPVIVLMLFLTAEAGSWSISIARHAIWLIEHPENEAGMATSGTQLLIAVIFSGAFSLATWMIFVHFVTLHVLGECIPIYPVLMYTFPMLIQLTHIHLWSLIARYSCLHVDLWPVPSSLLFNVLRPFLKLKDMGYYCIKFESWSKLSERAKEHRSLLTDFLDILPDPVWTKDIHDRFTYVNSACCNKLLLNDYFHSLGKTGLELAIEIQHGGGVYTFGAVCDSSDRAVRQTKKPARFMEHGMVGNNFLALQVLKAPIFKYTDKGAELTGTIGVGRDVTVAWIEHAEIVQTLDNGDIEGAIKMMRQHKRNFEALIQPNNGNSNGYYDPKV